MRMSIRILTLVALSVSFTLPAVRAKGQQSAPASADAPIQITARKYRFDPNVITVRQGEHVKLVITATDRDHGFKLAAYHIDQRLKKGVPTTVEFTADQAGTFPFECSVYCGLGHGRMKGTLKVLPVSPADAPSPQQP